MAYGKRRREAKTQGPAPVNKPVDLPQPAPSDKHSEMTEAVIGKVSVRKWAPSWEMIFDALR